MKSNSAQRRQAERLRKLHDDLKIHLEFMITDWLHQNKLPREAVTISLRADNTVENQEGPSVELVCPAWEPAELEKDGGLSIFIDSLCLEFATEKGMELITTDFERQSVTGKMVMFVGLRFRKKEPAKGRGKVFAPYLP